MKKQTIIPSVAIAILVIAGISMLPHILDIVLFFLLAGALPGTSHVIGAGWMFVISLGLFGFVAAHIAARVITRRFKPSGYKVPEFADNLPLKRFHQI